MINVTTDLYVRICQLDGQSAPQPLPLSNGFSTRWAYKVLGAHAASETSEAYLVLSNDESQIWFISNRHLRTYAFLPSCQEMRVEINAASAKAA